VRRWIVAVREERGVEDARKERADDDTDRDLSDRPVVTLDVIARARALVSRCEQQRGRMEAQVRVALYECSALPETIADVFEGSRCDVMDRTAPRVSPDPRRSAPDS
jgi:hypothetical protein